MKICQLVLLLGLFANTMAFQFNTVDLRVISSVHKIRKTMLSATKIDDNFQKQQQETKSIIDIESLYELNECESGTEARDLLETILSENSVYDSLDIIPGFSAKGLPDAELALQTKIRNNRNGILDLIELNGNKDADRAALALFGVFIASVGSALVVNENLPGPEIVRFIIVWLLSFAPLGFVGLGLVKADEIQTFLVQLQRQAFPVYRKRMVQHEAGHFLMGHLLGLPVKGYSANAVKNAVEFYPLSDPQVGNSRARQLGFDSYSSSSRMFDQEIIESSSNNAPYYSKEGRGGDILEQRSVFRNAKNYTDNSFLKLPSQNEPKNAWPYRGFDERTLDKLTIISVAGVCAEILAFGNAEGGYADFQQLRQLFNSAQTELDDKDMQNRIRYALGYTMCQLRLHLGVLDSLADEMERSASVADCVISIENCDNISGNDDGMMEEYDRIRREKFRLDNMGLLEKVFLEWGGGKTKNSAGIYDDDDDEVEEGRGGGSIKKKFKITGDDPLYYALGIAFIFLFWASSGGLSLH